MLQKTECSTKESALPQEVQSGLEDSGLLKRVLYHKRYKVVEKTECFTKDSVLLER